MNYSFLPYDPIFPKLFEKEKLFLNKILGENILIEHFGSTSVPGLGGKGVIDIYILVPEERMKSVSNILKSNRYSFSDFFKDDNHLLYQINKREGNKEYHYHIHLSPIGSKNFKDCTIFRDYLRTHPESIKKYEKLKQSAIEKMKNVKDKKKRVKLYLETKKPIIDKIISRHPKGV